jgi:hypothetical protein
MLNFVLLSLYYLLMNQEFAIIGGQQHRLRNPESLQIQSWNALPRETQLEILKEQPLMVPPEMRVGVRSITLPLEKTREHEFHTGRKLAARDKFEEECPEAKDVRVRKAKEKKLTQLDVLLKQHLYPKQR